MTCSGRSVGAIARRLESAGRCRTPLTTSPRSTPRPGGPRVTQTCRRRHQRRPHPRPPPALSAAVAAAAVPAAAVSTIAATIAATIATTLVAWLFK